MAKPRPGKLLEGAILLAGREYERNDPGNALFHRPTPKIWSRKARAEVFTATAGVDFNGHTADGRPITFDAKETHEASWPIRDVTEDQLATLRRNKHGLSGLVIGFLPAWLCFWISIVELDQFLAAKWRESLSQDWCKAFGKLLPVDVRPSLRQKGRFVRHVRFLDGVKAADADAATSRVNAERLAAIAKASQLPLPESMNGYADQFGGEDFPALHPYEEDLPPKPLAEKPMSGRGSPFDLLEIAKRARRKGYGGKKWGDRG